MQLGHIYFRNMYIIMYQIMEIYLYFVIMLLIYFLLPFVNNIDVVRIHIENRFLNTVYKRSWPVRKLLSLKFQVDKVSLPTLPSIQILN